MAHKELTKLKAKKYFRALKKRKGEILDTLCEDTGWSRDTVCRQLKGCLKEKEEPIKRGRVCTYSRSFGTGLIFVRTIWQRREHVSVTLKRTSGRTRKVYDKPKTPQRSLMECSALPKKKKDELKKLYKSLNDAEITRTIVRLQNSFLGLLQMRICQGLPIRRLRQFRPLNPGIISWAFLNDVLRPAETSASKNEAPWHC